MAQDKLTKFTEDEILREKALAREKYQRDILSWKCALEDESHHAVKDLALKLMRCGYSIEEAADFTGLSIDEIK